MNGICYHIRRSADQLTRDTRNDQALRARSFRAVPGEVKEKTKECFVVETQTLMRPCVSQLSIR